MPVKVQKTKKFYEILNIMNFTGAKIARKEGTIALIAVNETVSLYISRNHYVTDFEDPSLKSRQ